MKKKLISFIIPHKGREQLLQKTIESVVRQDIDKSIVEIVIVTQNSKLSDSILGIKRSIDLSIFTRSSSESISALRNFGVEKSTGEYLAFLDADILLSSNWAQCMYDTLCELDTRVITSAVQVNSNNAPPLEKIRTALSNAITNQNVSFLPGRNLFLSRSTFYRIGGFPEHLITCEDYYFTDRANQLGDLFYTSTASYIHLGEDKDFNEMVKKEIWRGQSNLLSIQGRSIPISEIPSFIVPIGVLFFFILGIFALMAGFRLTAIISFGAFLTPLIAYSARLYFLTKNQVNIRYILKFYIYYFPARAIGTIGGIFKTYTE